MAITDRNLTVGTKLWARYKGQVHTAEVSSVTEKSPPGDMKSPQFGDTESPHGAIESPQ
jgi:hypothetical protein